MGTRLFFSITSLIILCGWITQTKQDIKKAEWLLGTWKNSSSKDSTFEQWTKTNSGEFTGKSYVLKEGDTVIKETIRLVQEKGTLFYIPVVKNQNNGLPVRFNLKSISDAELVFENMMHDFPQFISYTRISKDSLVAEISGTINGQERKRNFPMKRLK
ncbi:DUF6265 family protein [Pedobacter antarcticus]|uniref:DUF6265 family protein n=1 Tax=Pedobacter antarcticus TaxID=34086 RepID=UPI001C59CB46|nr:DUF6265 family protein [Pedobacter antarcticus]